MAKLSRFAKGGGVLLAGFGVAGMCGKIASTAGQQQKNEVLLVDGLGIGFGLPICVMLLTWATPKSVLDRYLCAPHFSEFESIAYRYFPSSCIRTLLFVMAISIPVFRKVRQFGDIHNNVPLWFNVMSRLFVYLGLGYCMLWVLVVLGMYFYALWLS